MSNYQTRLLERRAQFAQRWLQRLPRTRENLASLRDDANQPDLFRTVNKDFHQLSGAAGIYELKELCALAIAAEDICLALINAGAIPDEIALKQLQELLDGCLRAVADLQTTASD